MKRQKKCKVRGCFRPVSAFARVYCEEHKEAAAKRHQRRPVSPHPWAKAPKDAPDARTDYRKDRIIHHNGEDISPQRLAVRLLMGRF